MCFDSVNLYKYQFNTCSHDVNCVVLFIKTGCDILVQTNIPECDALAFSEGRKFPIAAFLSILEDLISSSVCLPIYCFLVHNSRILLMSTFEIEH
jgi:hypothetical protein